MRLLARRTIETAECGQPSLMQDQSVGQPSPMQDQSADTAECGQCVSSFLTAHQHIKGHSVP